MPSSQHKYAAGNLRKIIPANWVVAGDLFMILVFTFSDLGRQLLYGLLDLRTHIQYSE
jgi:hypothetical protein